MNPKEELESKITALLLGELPAEEAATLRETIAADAELSKMHDRLKLAIDLVRETVATPLDEPSAPVEALSLSAERREKLLESFKVVRPKELRRARQIKVDVRTWGALAAMLAGLLVVAGLMFKFRRGGVMAGEGFASASLVDDERGSRKNWSKSEARRKPSATPSFSDEGHTVTIGDVYSYSPSPATDGSQPLNSKRADPRSPRPAQNTALDLDGDGKEVEKTVPPRGTHVVLPAGITENFLAENEVADQKAASFTSQVYSVNAVGYVNRSIPSGFSPAAEPSIVANPIPAPSVPPAPLAALQQEGMLPTPRAAKGVTSGGGDYVGVTLMAKNSTAPASTPPGLTLQSPPVQPVAEPLRADGSIKEGSFKSGKQNAAERSESVASAGNKTLGDAEQKIEGQTGTAPTFAGSPDPAAQTNLRVYNSLNSVVSDQPGTQSQSGRTGVQAGNSGKADSFGNQLTTGKDLLGIDMRPPATAEPPIALRGGTSTAFSGAPRPEVRFDSIDDVIGKPGAEPSKPQYAAAAEIADLIKEQKNRGADAPSLASTIIVTNSASTGLPLSTGAATNFSMDGAVTFYNGVAATNTTMGSAFTMDASGQQGIDALGFYLNRDQELGAKAAANNRDTFASRLGMIVNRASGGAESGAEPGKRVQIALPQIGDLNGPSQTSDLKGKDVKEGLAERDERKVLDSTLVQDGKLFLESGRYEEAESRLKQASQLNPENQAAKYYMNLVTQQKAQEELRSKRAWSSKSGLSVDEKWAVTDETIPHPIPNPAKVPEERSAFSQSPRNSPEVTSLSREVENLKQVQEKLNTRITQEEVDLALPNSGIVQVIDQAEPEPAKRDTLWGRIKGGFGSERVSVARINVERDASDIAGGLKGNSGSSQAFDPYWIQDQFETIQSKPVLSKVADELKLSDAWAEKKGGGGKLTPEETYQILKKKVDVRQEKNSSLMDIRVKSDDPQEAAQIANTIAKVYQDYRLEARRGNSSKGIETLRQQRAEREKLLQEKQDKLEQLSKERASERVANPARPIAPGAAIPQPEIQTADNAFSTFSLNVSDVSFKLAAASLEKGVMPEPASVRSEEFINAFDYHDPEPMGSAPVAFAWERSRYPFAHDRDLLRFSIKTASSGRTASQPLNLVLLLDNSGSMERADRVSIRMECLRVLASQLKPQDRVSVVAFARTARLWVDGLPGNQAGELPQRVGTLSPEGGTNLEEAMNLAYQTALKHYLANGANRVVLLTDGAANLGDVKPESLKAKVEANRKQGIALDCFGIGWDGYNDDLLEVLSRNGDGRYGFINTPEAASTEFAAQLAGALKVAASDVKVQVEWNPKRVSAYRQIGYAKHQLKKEQFRDNTVDAAEIGAAEAGNALYVAQVNPAGEGPLGTVRVRFKVPGTTDYREHSWEVPYTGAARTLEQSSPAIRLAATASAFSEWLVSSPYASEVTPDGLLGYVRGVPESCGADPRPKKLEWMIRQAKSLSGK